MQGPSEPPFHLSIPDRALLLIFALGVVSLFLIANRGAYRGFFTGDDFDNLANAREVEISYHGKALLKPRLVGDQAFRAAAHFYYYAMVRLAGLRYRPYVAVIHVMDERARLQHRE